MKKTKKAGPAPTIALYNRQRAIPIKLQELQLFAEHLLEASIRMARKKKRRFLIGLPELSVVLISDRRMAELHRRFLKVEGPTDVITFCHGEIFVSVETARKHARRFKTSIGHELRLYIAHGVLHLYGFDDKDPSGALEMGRLQERLVSVANSGLAVPKRGTTAAK